MKISQSFFVAVAIAFGAVVLSFPVSATSSRPNVLFILTDDQGYGDLSCHGNPILKTPNIDKLHDESIRFTDFHVSPMCTPSRGQLMTGVDALRNGAMNVSSGRTLLRREFPTMPEIFGSNDYRTAIFGKWHLGDNFPYRPQDRGFQESVWFPSSHIPSAAGYWNNDYFDDVYTHGSTNKNYKGYCTDVFVGEAIQWMRERSKSKEPFFCYLPLNAAHAPYFVEDKYREPYKSLKASVASFFGMIANIDENIARLEAFLRETGLRDNTILFFMTDNGTSNGETVFNAGMRGKKIDLYEGGHRVPFFIRWPAGNLRASTDCNVLTEAQDLLPTLIDLCDLKKPRAAKFDGISLAKLLRDKTDTLPDRMLVSQFSRMNQPQPKKDDAVVMWEKWRLVSGKELYDIAKDGGQQSNVFAQFPHVARKMQQHYDDWWEKIQPRVDDLSAIHIGSEKETPTKLTPCDWGNVFLDQQAQVRRVQRNGAWKLFVEREGDYEFSLWRWPEEAALAITAAAPEYKCVDGVYRAGDAFPIAEVEMQVSEFHQSKPVAKDDKHEIFQVHLPRGETQLQTWFRDANGKEICGAYYVYIRAVKEVSSAKSEKAKL